ncbi:CPBP family intramembrane metalloprotease [Maribacter confluentis]|uniref:CPBP family intramembrane metalloprotease n=1 Tax=Maribacter confluentis TaxID=1656093 RepID=A0ABT8RWH7_9FLAO|nr:CPBP family intramembrane glutamic endopeptidase [Maribacter confluentis]MDO1514637.1 CPBP family intramembrane metalloprotease [Maribacter confluentis]
MLEELYAFAKRPEYQIDANRSSIYRWVRLVQLLLISLALSVLLLTIAGVVQQIFDLDMGKHAVEDLFAQYSPMTIFFLAVIVAPILEELVFRAPLVYFKNKTSFPKIFYAFTILFGLVHISNFEWSTQVILFAPLLVAPQICAGFILGFIRIKFGLLWSIILHGLYNLILLAPVLIVTILKIDIK